MPSQEMSILHVVKGTQEITLEISDQAARTAISNAVPVTFSGMDRAETAGSITLTPSIMLGATGSSDGRAGTVPQPKVAERSNFLRGDGKWIAERFNESYKSKLDGIATGAEVNVQSDWNVSDSTSDAFIKNKPSLATVATSGSYADLSNTPTIPVIPESTTDIVDSTTYLRTYDGHSVYAARTDCDKDGNDLTLGIEGEVEFLQDENDDYILDDNGNPIADAESDARVVSIGTLPIWADRAEKDASGNDIEATYATKSELSAPIYPTLQAAIADSAKLSSGTYFETNGFNSENDGGASRYFVTTGETANAMDIVSLGNGKQAVLQVQDDALYPEQLGYVPTKTYAERIDCTPYFNRIWARCSTVRLRKSRYWFNGYLTLPLGGKIIGEAIYGDDVSEMSTYRSGDYFVYCENRENVIENVVLSNRSNNGSLSPVSTGGVGIRSNEWLHDGAAHFDYAFRHLRLMGFRKGMELQGTTKWAVTLYDIRCSQCYIGIEFGEASFNIDLHKIYADHCTYAGINFHGEGVFGFYDCNLGSINTAVKVSEYAGSQYNDILLTFTNTNFECDDQTLTNMPGLYFDIDNALDVVLNLYGCRFMQNAGVYTVSNRCMKLGAKTMVNIKGCEVRNNTGTAQANDNFWNEDYPCKFTLGAIRISDNCRGIPNPHFTDSRYDLCCVTTDLDIMQMVSHSSGGTPVNNLYDNSYPVTIAGYVSEANGEHPNGFFTLNNSTQVTLAIPITGYMQGQTVRISAGTTTHNRWKYGKIGDLPTATVTDLTFVNTTSTDSSGRTYSDIQVGASETGYILIYFNNGSVSTSDFIDDVMACVSPYYTPYEAYQGGTTTYSRQIITNLINGDELSTAMGIPTTYATKQELQDALGDLETILASI